MRKGKASQVLISVVICTYNRSYLLKRALSSLSKQTLNLEHFEVVVVDDGSRDETAKLCDMMRSELPNLRYTSTGNNVGVAGARNIGVKVSSGNYILFTDDDCIAAKNWVEYLSAALNREPIAAGAIVSPVSNYFKLCHNIAEFHAVMKGKKAGPVDFLAGANMGFRRSVLEELGGFDVRSVAEDMELVLRARMKGYRVFFLPEAVVMHDPDRSTFTSIVKYSANHASETILLRNKYRSMLKTPMVLRSPSLILATAPLIALKVTASIYLLNPGLIKYFPTLPMVFALKLAWCWGAARGLRNQKNLSFKEERIG